VFVATALLFLVVFAAIVHLLAVVGLFFIVAAVVFGATHRREVYYNQNAV
jgi:hypothetical protein